MSKTTMREIGEMKRGTKQHEYQSKKIFFSRLISNKSGKYLLETFDDCIYLVWTYKTF